MSASKTISKLIFSILTLCATAATVNATTITGTFNSASYQTISLNVATASTVDFQYLSGYHDPNFSLFDGANNHIISNDDSNSSLFSHITQNLAAGNYTLLVTYCCGGVNGVAPAVFSNTDGFNTGSYFIGGSATLGSLEAYLNTQAFGGAAGAQFSIAVTNAAPGTGGVPGTPVPEPQSLALFGLALATLTLARRRQLRK